MSNENSSQITANVVANALPAKPPVEPTYVALARRISVELEGYGIKLKDQPVEIDGVPGNKGWACWEHAETGHKIYLSRSKLGTGAIHTTLKVNPRTPGYIDPKGKAPGKIESFFLARENEVLAYLLPLFAETTEALRGRAIPAPTTGGELQTMTAAAVGTTTVG